MVRGLGVEFPRVFSARSPSAPVHVVFSQAGFPAYTKRHINSYN